MIFENHSNLIGFNVYVDVEHWLCSRSWSYYCGPGREHGPDLQSFLHVCRLEGWGGGVLDEPSLHFPSGQQWTESSAVSSFLSLGVSMMFDTSSRRLLAGLLAVTNVWTRPPACRSQCTKCIFKITALPKSHQENTKIHDRVSLLQNYGTAFDYQHTKCTLGLGEIGQGNLNEKTKTRPVGFG